METESPRLLHRELSTRSITSLYQEKALEDSKRGPNGTKKFGLLTQTVIPSSLTNWILIARLRQSFKDDIAFIGNDFVLIKELHDDGFLYDVIRKEGFGSRIRNARVVGSLREYEDDLDECAEFGQGAGYSGHNEKHRQYFKRGLPPQSLALQLCSGDVIFLRIDVDEQGSITWISSRYRTSKSANRLQTGIYLAVDPSSKYLALGCSEGILTLCALSSRKKLKEQFALDNHLKFVESETQIFIDGAILKMEFLHHAVSDRRSITLLVVVAQRGKTRMFFYNWEFGINLKMIRPSNPKGNLLHEHHKIPLLLIPLSVKTSFMLVYESFVSVYEGMLHGNPAVADHNISVHPTLQCFHGQKMPHWVTWIRPPRTPRHRETKDDIYLIREDGLLSYIEIDDDAQGLLSSESKIGELEISCGPAAACISYDGFDISKSGGDLIIIEGDSSSGGTYMLLARKKIQLCQPITSWHPTYDFVTTSPYQESGTLAKGKNSPSLKKKFPQPNRIFTCGGKGRNGVITELQHGIEAKISLYSEYDSSASKSWVFHESVGNYVDNLGRKLFLLDLGNSSAVLQLDRDGTGLNELDGDLTKFDLRYRTVTALQKNTHIIQVTEKSIIRSGKFLTNSYDLDTLLSKLQNDTKYGQGTTIHNAAIKDNFVVFTTSIQGSAYTHLLEFIDSESSSVSHDIPGHLSNVRVITLSKFSSNITCLAICELHGIIHAIVCEWDCEFNTLYFLPINGETSKTLKIPCETSRDLKMEAIISLTIQSLEHGRIVLVSGSRDGILSSFDINIGTLVVTASRHDRIGATSVVVSEDISSIYGTFAICDSSLFVLKPKEIDGKNNREYINSFDIHRVWLTDAMEPGLLQPKICSIASQPIFQFDKRNHDFLLTTESHVIIASFCPITHAIPRQIRLGGTPSRLLYSDSLKALIVGVLYNRKSTLLFIDPETGRDLSQPVDHITKKPVEFTSGLGHLNERIFRLFEWIFIKDKKQWNFIVVSTSFGRVLIISVDAYGSLYREVHNLSLQQDEDRKDIKERSKITYYTRHKFWTPKPAYSVVGYPDGLLWCAGKTLFCDALNLADKRFKRLAEYELPSPASNLSYEDGIIYALTMSHSLEVLKLVKSDSGNTEIIRILGDPITRPSLNHIVLESNFGDSVHLISDKLGNIIGLESTKNAMMNTLETKFEARVPESIIRLRRGMCRPLWDPIWVSDEVKDSNYLSLYRNSSHEILTNMEKLDMLGLTITGSLIHFTILDVKSWRFLKFLNNLAIKSPRVCEFTYQENYNLDPLQAEISPKAMMHVDGDVLKRCLKNRLVEEILGFHAEESQNTADSETTMKLEKTKINFSILFGLLQDLHYGNLAENEARNFYIKQTYCDLEFFLRQAL
ncbi:putative thermotolerance protein [Golovinomyces cichoracearum]|uniref:Putative thermotolerance protein n=1 Tax=Golovinomyces cichoracearum TaxID=62708 RepID=A0A420IF40_9PEZI|nr:putative thermotolerance protein [Golovinomyces cichoracearum]